MRRAPIKPLPSRDVLLALFSYETTTGILRWKPTSERWRKRFVGKSAGTITARGYIAVGIKTNGKTTYYLAHRIIWKMMTGNEPQDQIDHRDGSRLNNRWRNLRAAANGPNLQNAKLRADNKSGVKGVSWDRSHKKWKAVISVDKQAVQLGRFGSVSAAETAIINARQHLHGEFARAR